MINYTFGGPYHIKINGKVIYTHYAVLGGNGYEFLGGIADGHLLQSSNVTKELQEIQKVLSGQKSIHKFGGSDALLLRVSANETEFYNLLTDEDYGKVPTAEVVKLLTEWRDFLVSKGQ